jgi:hypothetical protein
MEGFFIIMFILLIIIVVAQIIKSANIQVDKKEMGYKLNVLSDFTSTQKILGDDGKTGLAIDEKRKKIGLITQNHIDVISYSDILSSEIFEDGDTITRSSRTSQVGGALLGGLVLGGVGAIIGGLSGRKTSSKKVNRIDLRLTVNRTQSPIHDINFYNGLCKRTDSIYKKTIDQVRHWHGLIDVLIRIADRDDQAKENEASSSRVDVSVADELAKLADLQKKGIISEEEFATQKSKLLS